ncbi:hypothetical protein Q8A73_010984 [Channa argus]|nr:hypothetical protein Q8A73_010984 [Channa argus]
MRHGERGPARRHFCDSNTSPSPFAVHLHRKTLRRSIASVGKRLTVCTVEKHGLSKNGATSQLKSNGGHSSKFCEMVQLLMFRCPVWRKRAYKSYAKALPGLKKIGITSVLLRKIIGSLEVGCGVVLTLVPGRPKDVANFLLLLVMLAVLFFHQLVGDPLKRYAHALVFGILLTCRLLIARQSDDRPEREDSREEQHLNDQEKNKVKQS